LTPEKFGGLAATQASVTINQTNEWMGKRMNSNNKAVTMDITEIVKLFRSAGLDVVEFETSLVMTSNDTVFSIASIKAILKANNVDTSKFTYKGLDGFYELFISKW